VLAPEEEFAAAHVIAAMLVTDSVMLIVAEKLLQRNLALLFVASVCKKI
jgi:hypothetical protein